MLFLAPSLLTIVFLGIYIRRIHNAAASQRALALQSLKTKDASRRKFIGFFHPYCNAGGGGERVLWTAVAFLQRTRPDVISVVYSGDTDATKEEIIEKVKARFDITLAPESLHFVFLQSRWLVEDSAWPRFTLLGQSLGSMYLGWEAITKFVPDLFIDTMGYAFTFHVVAWLTGISIGAYVHYPTISTDMLARVESRRTTYANSSAITSSPLLSRGKLLYYRFFMYHYARALRCASFLMVNSSWTKKHVDAVLAHSDPLLDALHTPLVLLGGIARSFVHVFALPFPTHTHATPKEATIVYPPCDTLALARLPLEPRGALLLSLAQFRPEKDHAAQVHAMAALLAAHPEHRAHARLVLVGGVRNAGDAARVDELRALAEGLGVADRVEIVVNAPYPRILELLGEASAGLNTMVDEHFGINVVEFMAAGVIPIVHASGGPLNDIVVPIDGRRTGFHATDPEGFARAMHEVLVMPAAERLAMRERARARATVTFSEKAFEEAWTGSGWVQWL
ncbi:mannosyltransferase [Gloeopeniophorella convolvens]|nr:mannosyltransferase [Gloeopeniophorella convolvens]